MNKDEFLTLFDTITAEARKLVEADWDTKKDTIVAHNSLTDLVGHARVEVQRLVDAVLDNQQKKLWNHALDAVNALMFAIMKLYILKEKYTYKPEEKTVQYSRGEYTVNRIIM